MYMLNTIIIISKFVVLLKLKLSANPKHNRVYLKLMLVASHACVRAELSQSGYGGVKFPTGNLSAATC